MKLRQVCMILTLLMIVSSSLFAGNTLDERTQERYKDYPLSIPHWMTGEELDRIDTIGRDFYVTDPPPAPIRQIAEFEPMYGGLIRYPLSIPTSLVVEMSQDAMVVVIASSQSQANSATSQFNNAGVNMDNVEFLIAPTDMQWTRDYGPWFIFDGNDDMAVVNFPYNRPRPNDDDIPIEYAEAYSLPLYGMNIIHTGGNYMCDGLGQAVSTDLVYEENSISNDTIHQLIEDYCGITNYHVTADPLGDYIKHVDCWGKYLDVDKILIGQVAQSDPRYEDYEAIADYFANETSSWGTPYQVYRVFSPGGDYTPTPYTNSLILNNKVFVPQSGSQYDDDAIAVYEEAMPGYEIVGISYSGWYDTDALHCRVHEIPDEDMLYVHHMPIHGEVGSMQDVEITAYVHPYSGQELVSDSLRVFYKIAGETEWHSVAMTNADDENYTATIPGAVPNSEVMYYIRALDEAGKSANHPYIGKWDPHTYTTGTDTEFPGIEFDEIADTPINELPLNLSAIVTDDGGVETVEMRYMINAVAQVPLAFTLSDSFESVWNASFHPEDIEVNDLIHYRIAAIDYAGNETEIPESGYYSFTIDSPSSIDDNEDTLQGDLLLGNFPNPFNRSQSEQTSVRFYLANNQNVEVAVFNIRGQLVKSLHAGKMDQGYHDIRWNGLDTKGREVSSGVYFLRMKTSGKSTIKKMILFK